MIAQLGGSTQGRVCWVATLPERADVDRMLDANVPLPQIARWLAVDRGYGAAATTPRVVSYARGRSRVSNA